MSWVAVAAAAVTVVGGAIASDSASSAADSQAQGAAQSDATQRYMYDQSRADNATFLGNGTAANDKLSYALGIGPKKTPGHQYTLKDFQGYNKLNDPAGYSTAQGMADAAYQLGQYNSGNYGADDNVSKAFGFAAPSATDDGSYNALNRKFAQTDLNADPVYQNGLQFGLDQGVQGINRMAAANGGTDNGAILKALTRFGNDYGSTKAGDSYNRFKNDQSTEYNMLAGLSGTGQVASGQVGQAGMNAANNISQTQASLGNARGASAIAQSNAWGNGLSQGVNAYQQKSYMDLLRGNNSNNGFGASGYGNTSAYDNYSGQAAANGGWGIE